MCEHTYSVNRPSTFLFIYKALSHLLTSGVSQRPHELEGQRKHTLFYKGGNRFRKNWSRHIVSISFHRWDLNISESPVHATKDTPYFLFEFFSRPRQLLPLFIKKWRHSFTDPFNYHAFIKYLIQI